MKNEIFGGYQELLKCLSQEEQPEIAQNILLERYERELDKKPKGTKSPSDHINELIYFIDHHSELSKAELLREWNENHADHQYKSFDNMKRVYRRGKKRWGF